MATIKVLARSLVSAILLGGTVGASAEVLFFERDGRLRASAGWVFHGEAKSEVERLAPGHGVVGRHAAEGTRTQGPSASLASRGRVSPPPGVAQLIEATAHRYASHPALAGVGLDALRWSQLFQAMIEAESTYRVTALSPKGAYGLGQLMPATAAALGVDRTDPAANLDGAARYLIAHIAHFGSVELALAAYNAGPHRVVAYRGVPPFEETRAYLARIAAIYDRLSPETPAPLPTLARPTKEFP
ncbi:MAG: lytic transglycosylase domain-containing protein [Pseudomonadota bacterium]